MARDEDVMSEVDSKDIISCSDSLFSQSQTSSDFQDQSLGLSANEIQHLDVSS